MVEALRQFQKDFLKKALAPGIDTAALSMPRGNGKSFLAGYILSRCLTPGDDLHVEGAEYLLCAGSLEQAGQVFKFIRPELEPRGGYRFAGGSTRMGIVHEPTNTRLRVLSSNAKTAMGIVGCPMLVADEPGAWETIGGALMHTAIQTAHGKPGSPMRVLYIGTLAPKATGPGHWWYDLVKAGTRKSVYVKWLQGDLERWSDWNVIRKANPLCNIDQKMRDKLIEERDDAQQDVRKKGEFLSYRLNIPTGDESKVLLTVPEFLLLRDRKVGVREGRPIVACDLWRRQIVFRCLRDIPVGQNGMSRRRSWHP